MTRVSIVIPVYGKATLTRQCLRALLRDPLGVDAELIVVDDASPDDTPALLAELVAGGAPIRVITHRVNSGFAVACNHGASAATGEYIVFLNNDTIPTSGWLEALVRDADHHPLAAAIGAKLLFPDGTVQHAGLAFGHDANAHHVYAGFPGDHPAVNRSRELQAVTGACILVRRAVFDELGGFDAGYRNGHEDVDLCLRCREAGYRVRYCHESVVVHLESVSRGRRSSQAAANGQRYRDRWAAWVEPDDLSRYLEDGLIKLTYDETSLRLEVSPLLATVDDNRQRSEINELLRARAQQVAELLRWVASLVAADRSPSVTRGAPEVAPMSDPELDDELAEAVAHLQRVLAARADVTLPVPDTAALSYRRLVRRVRRTIGAATPAGATVAVVSRGDDALIAFEDRMGRHLPCDAVGRWVGHHPRDSAEALAALAKVGQDGATHLVVPAPSRWWLDQYRGFADHLRRTASEVVSTEDCTVYALTPAVVELPA